MDHFKESAFVFERVKAKINEITDLTYFQTKLVQLVPSTCKLLKVKANKYCL